MGMLKVGDKLEVLINNPNLAIVLKGSILTVVEPDGYNTTYPSAFLTNDPLNIGSTWIFDMSHIGKELKLLIINPTLVSTPMQFKVGDTTEWSDGSHWEIVKENANDFEIKLVQLGNYHGYFSQKIGDTIWHPKTNFNVAKLVVPQIHTLHQQNMELATYTKQETKTNNCCCGAWACKDSGHSTWCDLYKPMWKDG